MARTYNGTSDRTKVTYSFSATTWSYAVLFKPRVVNVNQGLIVSDQGAPTSAWSRALRIKSNGALELYPWPSATLTSAASLVQAGKWQLAVATFVASGTQRLYLNEEEVASASASTAWPDGTSQHIGSNDGAVGWFDGEIAWAAAFDVALSQDDVIALARATSLIWPDQFDESKRPVWFVLNTEIGSHEISGNQRTITQTGTTAGDSAGALEIAASSLQIARLAENISLSGNAVSSLQVARLAENISHTSPAVAQLQVGRISINISVTPLAANSFNPFLLICPPP